MGTRNNSQFALFGRNTKNQMMKGIKNPSTPLAPLGFWVNSLEGLCEPHTFGNDAAPQITGLGQREGWIQQDTQAGAII